jgi:hypothetical protein
MNFKILQKMKYERNSILNEFQIVNKFQIFCLDEIQN